MPVPKPKEEDLRESEHRIKIVEKYSWIWIAVFVVVPFFWPGFEALLNRSFLFGFLAVLGILLLICLLAAGQQLRKSLANGPTPPPDLQHIKRQQRLVQTFWWIWVVAAIFLDGYAPRYPNYYIKALVFVGLGLVGSLLILGVGVLILRLQNNRQHPS